MKMFGVCIGNYVTESNFIFCQCKTKTEARVTANLYRRQWHISEPIQKIVEIPGVLKDDDKGRRAYAVMGA